MTNIRYIGRCKLKRKFQSRHHKSICSLMWEQVSGHRDKKKGMCPSLQLKKEETQGHILSLLCCLRAGSQHLVVSLTWGNIRWSGAAWQRYLGSTEGFPFKSRSTMGRSVPCGSTVGLAKGTASVEPFWILPKKATRLPKVSPRETVTQTIKKQGPRGKRRGKHKTLQGAMVQRFPAGKAPDSETLRGENDSAPSIPSRS